MMQNVESEPVPLRSWSTGTSKASPVDGCCWDGDDPKESGITEILKNDSSMVKYWSISRDTEDVFECACGGGWGRDAEGKVLELPSLYREPPFCLISRPWVALIVGKVGIHCLQNLANERIGIEVTCVGSARITSPINRSVATAPL